MKSPSIKNNFISNMIYWFSFAVVRLMAFIPLSVGQFLGRMLGVALTTVQAIRKEISLSNLRFALGNTMTETEIKKLHRRFIIHFCQVFFEIPHILRLSPTSLDRYVIFENQENLLSAMKKGKGVFVLTGHFGNWELMAAAISLRFAPNSAVVARPIDFLPGDKLINTLRSRFGAKVIPKEGAMKHLIRAMRENKVVGILLDQNVDWYEGVFVPFFGRRACTNKGLALVAQRAGSPVVPAFSVRQKDGRYRIIFEKALELSDTGNKARDVEENTALFTRVIERYIRQYPDHWFWFHRRWKTRPYCPLPQE